MINYASWLGLQQGRISGLDPEHMDQFKSLLTQGKYNWGPSKPKIEAGNIRQSHQPAI